LRQTFGGVENVPVLVGDVSHKLKNSAKPKHSLA
jgi:hypothetical protein